jgi:shikimate kinase
VNGFRRVLLVGFMGSGKSSVGRRVARSLGWHFRDFDEAVEEADGRSVPVIFAESGEDFFRAAEARVAEGLLARDGVVLASGGGWAAVPGRLSTLPPGTCSVWLKVSAELAVERAGRRPGRRPLLAVEDPLSVARALLDARSPLYALCDFEVDTEGLSVDDVSSRVLKLLGRSPATHTAANT